MLRHFHDVIHIGMWQRGVRFLAEEESVGVAVYVPHDVRHVNVLDTANSVLESLDASSWHFVGEAASRPKGVGPVATRNEALSNGLPRLVLCHF